MIGAALFGLGCVALLWHGVCAVRRSSRRLIDAMPGEIDTDV